MKAIKGVVINEQQIEILGGTILTYKHKFNTGANVLINYDFTEMKTRDVRLASSLYPGASEPDEIVVKRYDDCDVHPDEINAICR